MRWSKEAEQALSKVPFFVRRRVRKRVEAEAKQAGSEEVLLSHVESCRRRFLENMEREVRGYQVETCFGSGGCPNRAVPYESVAERIEERLAQRSLKAFLRERVQGPLKFHHEFRVTVSDCPNACSRPQITDMGLIGAAVPAVHGETCTGCGGCVEVCREEAIFLNREEDGIIIREDRCLACGACVRECPEGALQVEKNGYRILVGGKLGRHPRLGTELPGVYPLSETFDMVDRCLDFYVRHCERGERFGEILERVGMEVFLREVKKTGKNEEP